MTKHLIERDLKHIWHPCSQMKDYEQFAPLAVESAQGCHITLKGGRNLIDAISSWWCKSLGHGHPQLKKALYEQCEQFEHVILANTTNEVIVELSEKLCALAPNLNKVFYAGDGSCAVEIALKMSLHARQIQGQNQRSKFIALQNGYHGETVGTLSVSDLGLYRDPYKALFFPCYFLQDLPYVSGQSDPQWHNCSDHWPAIEAQLAPLAETATALILEPLVQGAGGMLLYSPDLLRRLRHWCDQNDVHLIADEIMTGIGRTGKMLALDHAGVHADFVCLSKSLTSGWLPFSAMLTTDAIYELFYQDYHPATSFLHSHTYTGNALGAKLALTTLQVMQQDNICQRVQQLEIEMRNSMLEIAENTGKLTNIRALGGMVAADLCNIDLSQRQGFAIYQRACELGALLRPLGNTLYWLPPLITDQTCLHKLQTITQQAIEDVT